MADHEPLRDARLAYEVRALSRSATVLHVGTHPDDEETGLLAYLGRGRGVRTVYWSATRGEGGQNRIGPETGDALGVLRTWESLAACEINGAEARYGPFYDFGFSKTGEDTLARWGREAVVREIVRAIREVMPHVVIARWSGGPTDGHGQHQAIGMVTAEAVTAAGDPDCFPELLEAGLRPWVASKLYHSVAGDWQPGEEDVSGRRNHQYDREGLLRVNAGALEPVSGRSFQELAALSWNRHRTQAIGFLPERGDHHLYYRLVDATVEGARPEEDFFDGLDLGLAAHFDRQDVDLGPVRKELQQAQEHAEQAFRDLHVADRGPAVAAVLTSLRALRHARGAAFAIAWEGDREHVLDWLDQRIERHMRAATRLLGLSVECRLDRAHVTPGERVGVTVRVAKGDLSSVAVTDVELLVPEGYRWKVIGDDHADGRVDDGPLDQLRYELEVPLDAAYSTPYWARAVRGPNAYQWPEDSPDLGLPFDRPVVHARCTVAVGEDVLQVVVPGVLREAFPGGYRELPLQIRPAVVLHPGENQLAVAVAEDPQRLEVRVTATCTRPGGVSGAVRLRAPDDWRVEPEQVDLTLAEAGESRTIGFAVEVPPGTTGDHSLSYFATVGETDDSVVHDAVRQLAPGLPGPATEENCVAEAFLGRPADVVVHLVDAAFVPDSHIGWVTGAGDAGMIPVLRGFGVEVATLSDEDLGFADLSAFDSIVVGPNAYLQRPALRRQARRLLDYVEDGGTLVVQYQSYDYASGDHVAPFPFAYSQPHDRVTDPNAPVVILSPDHPAFTSPNQIGPADFEGWVRDRGLYFLGEWDDRYQPLLASWDRGEAPREGGLLVANHGRGTYAYVAYSLFRQVPAAVPGAIRLLANLVGLSDARIQQRVARLRGVPLFQPMTDDELRAVAVLIRETWYPDGTVLSLQGEAAEEFYLVAEGALEAIREGGEGGSEWVYTAEPGDFVGELAPLAGLRRSATLRVKGDTRVLSMRGDEFRQLLWDHPEIARDVLRTLAQRLAVTSAREG